MFAEWVDFEAEGEFIAARDGLFFKVYFYGGVRVFFCFGHQFIDLFLRKGDWKDAVFEAVVVEDIGEAWRDDAAQAHVQQCPRGMFSAGAAAEILTGDQDICAFVFRFVEGEVGALVSVVVVANVVKSTDAKASSFDCFQELFGDDDVGVDVDHL